MNKLLLTLTAALAGTAAMAQEAPTAQPASSSTSCLIVKHKGTVGRRLMYTALIGVPIAPGSKYDLVDSENFQNASATYKGKELDKIQSTGTRVIILENKYKPEDLQAARNTCGEPGSATKVAHSN